MKTHCKILALGSALLGTAALGTSSAQAQPAMIQQMRTAGMQLRPVIDANLDRMFILHAAQGNMFEVMSGQLALRKSRNPGVRMVAQTLITGHSAAQRDLAKVAQAKGVALPPNPGPMNLAVYRTLSTLRGAAFDKAFMGGQVDAHEKTIVLFEHEMMSGQDPRAKAHATNKLPDIIGHTAMIYTVARQVGAPGVNLRPPTVLQSATQANARMMSGMRMTPGMGRM
ncbi:MAG TPA: DUF4142 domain-containing protein [Abditibacterium sp.]|jgi:putative membrane protein